MHKIIQLIRVLILTVQQAAHNRADRRYQRRINRGMQSCHGQWAIIEEARIRATELNCWQSSSQGGGCIILSNLTDRTDGNISYDLTIHHSGRVILALSSQRTNGSSLHAYDAHGTVAYTGSSKVQGFNNTQLPFWGHLRNVDCGSLASAVSWFAPITDDDPVLVGAQSADVSSMLHETPFPAPVESTRIQQARRPGEPH